MSPDIEMKAWLESLKPGDRCICKTRLSGIRNLIVESVTATIIRTLPCPIPVERLPTEWRRTDGKRRGSSTIYDYEAIEPLTDVVRCEIRVQRAKSVLVRLDWYKLPDAVLLAVHKAYVEASK